MKIKILQNVPVSEDRKPTIGSSYTVLEDDGCDGPNRVFMIDVNGHRVGVLARECAVVEE